MCYCSGQVQKIYGLFGVTKLRGMCCKPWCFPKIQLIWIHLRNAEVVSSLSFYIWYLLTWTIASTEVISLGSLPDYTLDSLPLCNGSFMEFLKEKRCSSIKDCALWSIWSGVATTPWFSYNLWEWTQPQPRPATDLSMLAVNSVKPNWSY